MRFSKQQRPWRPLVGVVAIGLFGISIAYAGPRTDKASSTGSVRAVETRRVVQVQPAIEGPLAVPTALGDKANMLEPLPQGMPIVITEIHMDMRTGGGIAAAGAFQAAIFHDGGDSGFFTPIKASDEGTFVAQQMIFGNRWTPGSSINGYSMTIFNHSAGPSGSMTVRTSLWDGDPLGIVDTQCSAGGVPAEIPGTAATFGPLADASGNDSDGLCAPLKLLSGPCVGLWKLTASFDKVVVNCDLAYMVKEPLEGCRVGWRLAGNTFSLLHDGPVVGFGDLVEWAYDCGQNGACATPTGRNAGTCCNTGETCDDRDVVDSCSQATFCTSGVADRQDAFSFGGGTPGYWATHVSDVQAATDVIFSLKPEGTDGDLVVSEGDFGVLLELKLSDFDPGQTGLALKAWTARIDPAGFTSGQQGTITLWAPACADRSDCEAIWGTTGEGGAPAECGYTGNPGVCTPVFIDAGRSDYVFYPELALFGADQSNLRAGSTLLLVSVGTTGGETYVMTVAVYVPEDAKGTFTICPKLGEDQSTLLDMNSQFVPLIGLVCATITVKTGQCCDLSGDPFVCIGNTTTANACAAAGGNSFVLGNSCADQCNCQGFSPPLPETLALPGNPVMETNRVLPVKPGNAGSQIAILVTFDDLPPPFNVLNGQSMWAGLPTEYCENSGQATPPVGGCGPAPGAPSLTFFASALQCSPFYTDWSGFSDVVHLFGEFIVPDGAYSIQLIREGCDGGTAENFSAALQLTTSKWGDIVKDCTTSPCGPPDGSIDVVTDVASMVDKFANFVTGPTKTRADIEPSIIDFVINITEQVFTLDAFAGKPYPFVPSTSTACP